MILVPEAIYACMRAHCACVSSRVARAGREPRARASLAMRDSREPPAGRLRAPSGPPAAKVSIRNALAHTHAYTRARKKDIYIIYYY